MVLLGTVEGSVKNLPFCCRLARKAYGVAGQALEL
jgi:hypothetical protein